MDRADPGGGSPPDPDSGTDCIANSFGRPKCFSDPFRYPECFSNTKCNPGTNYSTFAYTDADFRAYHSPFTYFVSYCFAVPDRDAITEPFIYSNSGPHRHSISDSRTNIDTGALAHTHRHG